jgi:hypothetical protein
MKIRYAVLLSCLLCFSSVAPMSRPLRAAGCCNGGIRRVLLLSIDGLHAVDLDKYVRNNPASTLAQLSGRGVTYSNASSTKPSDSLPGLLAMVTGGTPLSLGIFYDDAYTRALSPPMSDCATVGTKVIWKQNLDVNPDDRDTTIDPAKLPLDPANGCTPVFPHQYLKAKTIFEVIKASGGRTAWSDKHPAYEILNGPSGTGVDDLYTPEINAGGTTNDLGLTEAYDDVKVSAILNEIAGHDHTGKNDVGVPAIFGMNFQAVSVAQKLTGSGCPLGCGYTDATGTPSAGLIDALDHTDQSIGSMVDGLRKAGLLDSTLIILSAKHGNSPTDPSKLRRVNANVIADLVNGVQPGLLAYQSGDTIYMVWLTDQTQIAAVAAALGDPDNQAAAGIQEILSGEKITLLYKDPLGDSQTPDLIVVPNLGVVYTTSATKIADHGGFSDQDVHVPILLSNPALGANTIKDPVQTSQIACTILQALDVDCESLTAPHARSLPGWRGRGAGR